MMLLGLFFIVLGCCGLVRGGTALNSVNVRQCSSPEDAVVECLVKRGSVLRARGFGDTQGDILRVTGPGFVVRADKDAVGKFKMVVFEKTTLSCQDFIGTASTKMIINNADCGLELEEPTTTTIKIPTKEPKPRPPAKPVDDDGNDDEDDNDDNNGNTDSSTTVATTALMTTTLTVITVTATAAFREWYLILGIGVLVTSIGAVIIVKVRWQRRRRACPGPRSHLDFPGTTEDVRIAKHTKVAQEKEVRFDRFYCSICGG